MNEFHEPHPLSPGSRDPLERLVEAFVELSVPEGPDAAIQRNLVATLRAAPIELAAAPRRAVVEASWWVRYGRQALALAAGVLMLVTATLLVALRRDDGVGSPTGSGEQIASDEGQSSEAIRDELIDLLDYHINSSDGHSHSNGGRASANSDFFAIFNAVLKQQSDLSKSDGWRRAQQRLALALEQPEVIGVGVGLLGTLPWATHGRF